MSAKRIHNLESLEEVRKNLRNSLTPAEAILWKNLQRSQLDGKRFRRQHSVGNYIVDFYCPECRLAVEFDGEGHFNSMASQYDVQRTDFLNSLNIRLIRFENGMVFESLEGVLETIRRHLRDAG
jgi:very-short-patch-repair endonuclease